MQTPESFPALSPPAPARPAQGVRTAAVSPVARCPADWPALDAANLFVRRRAVVCCSQSARRPTRSRSRRARLTGWAVIPWLASQPAASASASRLIRPCCTAGEAASAAEASRASAVAALARGASRASLAPTVRYERGRGDWTGRRKGGCVDCVGFVLPDLAQPRRGVAGVHVIVALVPSSATGTYALFYHATNRYRHAKSVYRWFSAAARYARFRACRRPRPFRPIITLFGRNLLGTRRSRGGWPRSARLRAGPGAVPAGLRQTTGRSTRGRASSLPAAVETPYVTPPVNWR